MQSSTARTGQDSQAQESVAKQPLVCDKKQAAYILGISERTIDNLVRRGHLKPVKIFRRALFKYSDLVGLVRKGGAK